MSQNGGSLWYRARRSHLGVACVVALTLFTDMLTYGAVLPVLPALVIQRLKGDSSTVGFLFGCYAFGLLLATPGFAILSDKYQNRRYPMMAGCIGLIISTLAFAAADSYTLLVLARMAQGVAGGASWTIGLGLLADVFPTHRLGVVMGTVLTAHTVGFAIGPALGGFLYEYGGYSAPFLCCAAFALLNLIAVVWVAEPLHGKVAQRAKGTRDSTPAHDQETASIHSASSSSAVADEDTPLLDAHPKSNQQKPLNMWSMCRNWRIMSCVLCTIVSASVFSGIEPAFPLHLEKVYDASASTVGLLFVAMVVPAFLAPLIGHLSDKLGRNVISATGMIMMAIASPLVAIHYPDVYMIVPSLMVFGLSSPVTLTPVLPEMGEVIADMGSDAYAQVFALYNIAYSAGMFIGPNCAGLVMAYAGFETLMLVFAGTLILCSPVMVKWSAVWHWFTVKLH